MFTSPRLCESRSSGNPFQKYIHFGFYSILFHAIIFCFLTFNEHKTKLIQNDFQCHHYDIALLVSLYFLLKGFHTCHEVPRCYTATSCISSQLTLPTFTLLLRLLREMENDHLFLPNKRGSSKMREGHSESSGVYISHSSCRSGVGHRSPGISWYCAISCSRIPSCLDQRYELLAYVCSHVQELAIRLRALN